MASKCANNYCPITRHRHEGKMFRLDIVVGNRTGGTQRKIEYVWLCSHCADKMHPKVDVTGDTVTLRLTKNLPAWPEAEGATERVN